MTGCALARQLIQESNNNQKEEIHVHVFDWGRSSGGRASHRHRPEPLIKGTNNNDNDKNNDDYHNHNDDTVVQPMLVQLHFDHGAQFFHADHPEFLDMIRPAIQSWPIHGSRLGWLDGETGVFSTTAAESESDSDSISLGFFGSGHGAFEPHRCVGTGGMDAICQEMLYIRHVSSQSPEVDLPHTAVGCASPTGHGRIHIHQATRVARCEYNEHTERSTSKRWELFGDGLGHEQADANALQASQQSQVSLGEFDELVITDHMAAAMPSWHPCHIHGLERIVPHVISTLRTQLDWDESERRFRAVQPLFSCMVAFERDANIESINDDHDGDDGMGHSASCLHVEYDAATVQGNPILQWVCSQESRPHAINEDDTSGTMERWILMSTTEFAKTCLGSEGMSKTVSSSSSTTTDDADADSKASTPEEPQKETQQVQYIPQTDEYLRSDPAQIMCDEFIKLVKQSHRVKGEHHVVPDVVFRKCQRWGAAYTVPLSHKDHHRLESMLRSYESSHHITLCGDFLKDGSSEKYLSRFDRETATYSYAIQDAALSGIGAAKRIVDRIRTRTSTL